MCHRPAPTDTLPVDIELTLTGLDLASRNALHSSVITNTRRAFSRLGHEVKQVRVSIRRAPPHDTIEAWDVTINVTLRRDRGREQRVHVQRSAARPHLALENALLSAWAESAMLLDKPRPRLAAAVA